MQEHHERDGATRDRSDVDGRVLPRTPPSFAVDPGDGHDKGELSLCVGEAA